MFRGSMVALVTPFKAGAVDEDRLRHLVDFHIRCGTHAIVAAGTTGESGTLTQAEKRQVIKIIVEEANERIPVIAGTAANATGACIELTKEAMACGVDAVLIMTPAYIKPTQEGLYQHYHHIAEEAAVPIILYNVPGRTACDMLPETVARLSHISNIIGIKEATGSQDRLKHLLELCETRLDVYSGDDLTAAAWMLAGAKGVISVTANVAPKSMARLCDAAIDGIQADTVRIQEQLLPLHELLFIESNPIPVKWALQRMGLIEGELRLPLTSLSQAHHSELARVLQSLSLI